MTIKNMATSDPWSTSDSKKSDWADAEFATDSSRGDRSRAPRGRDKPKPKTEDSKVEENKEQKAETQTTTKPRPKTPSRTRPAQDDQAESGAPPRHDNEEESKRPPGSRGRGSHRGRGGYRGGRHRAPGTGELATVRRRINRRLITNIHPDEVIYREEDDTLDPDAKATSLLKAAETWEELGLQENLVEALYAAGYEFPSKIQKVTLNMFQSIPDLQRLVAQSHTGSGKTAAFALASLGKVDVQLKATQVIVLAHTIELTQQICNEYKKFSECLGISVSTATRSQSTETGQVVIGTDGSIKRLINSGRFDLSHLRVVVLDEADHMLDVEEKREFYNDFKLWMENKFPAATIYLLFSATFNQAIIEKIEELLDDHYEIKIKKEDLVLSNIKQYYYKMHAGENKAEVADTLLKTVAQGLTIMFCNTCRLAQELYESFSKKGSKCALLIGRNMSIPEREKTMQDFIGLKYTLLITTNLLARGIDNKAVRNIINFDMPIDYKSKRTNYELYLHRIGRCGRFGRNGISISIAENAAELERIEGIREHYSCLIEEVNDATHLDAINTEREEKEKEDQKTED